MVADFICSSDPEVPKSGDFLTITLPTKKRALVSFGLLDSASLADARKKREAEELLRGNTFKKVATDGLIRNLPR